MSGLRGDAAGAAGYLAAVVLVAVAAEARWLLDPWLDENGPFMTFYLAVVISAWYGGWRPAVLASFLGLLLAGYFFMEPRFAISVARLADRIQLLVYLLVSLSIAAVSGTLRNAQRRSRDAEELSRRQEELLRVTLASIGDAVIATDMEGRVTLLNRVAVTLTGWTQEEAAGRPLKDVFHIVSEETGEPADQPVEQVFARGTVVGLANHTLLVARSGERFPIDDSAAPIRDEIGRVVGAVLVFRDVSERRRTEKQLQWLGAIVASSDDAIVSKNLNSIVTSWNRAAERIFGYTADEMIGQPITLLIPQDRAEEEPEILRRIQAGERVDHFETLRLRKDGQTIPISLTISPIVNAQGRVVGVSKIARDITARKQAEADLQEADRRKTEFLAILAHELRNPLAPIRTATRLLREAGGAGPVADSALDMIERQLAQMIRLVDDLLDVSRISRGKIELRKERIELAQVVSQAVEAAFAFCESREHELEVSLPPQPIYLLADPVRLTQVVGNLLSNACKFTEPGGHIWLTAAVDGDQAVLTVKDSGLGIPRDQLGRIFEMFTQLDGALERSQGGLGIGLSLVKSLVEMHGGTVEARSAGLGQGSEFIVRLPTLAARPSSPGAPAVERRDSSAASRRVLVVDDNRDAALSLARLLELRGHEVHTAHDGLEAVAAAEQLQPDVILLDIGLPRLNGYDAARRIREQLRDRVPTLVAVTGWGQDEDRDRSKAAGFDAHLVKPVDLQAVSRLLERAASARGT